MSSFDPMYMYVMQQDWTAFWREKCLGGLRRAYEVVNETLTVTQQPNVMNRCPVDGRVYTRTRVFDNDTFIDICGGFIVLDTCMPGSRTARQSSEILDDSACWRRNVTKTVDVVRRGVIAYKSPSCLLRAQFHGNYQTILSDQLKVSCP
jgi:hypothetical protein